MSEVGFIYPSYSYDSENRSSSVEKKKRNLPSPRTIWIVAGIIIAIVIIIAIILISTQSRQQVEIPTSTDIINLDNLIDLDNGGLCCVPPATSVTERYIYLPSTDTTYTLNEIDPNIVCQNETGSNLDACLSKFSDENGDAKAVAHKGINIYYGFSPGQAGSVCNSFVACP